MSSFQAHPLMDARRHAHEMATTSLDLGISFSELRLTSEGALLPDGAALSWEGIEHMIHCKKDRLIAPCFLIKEGVPHEIRTYSADTERPLSLVAGNGAPTLLLAGFTMHRIKGTDPQKDTEAKLGTITPTIGRVLDTATGLGYTAIGAAHTAKEVVTIELDPAVLALARLNPWSRQLFSRSNITQRLGDASLLIRDWSDRSFTRIIHDPPALSLAGDLYAGTFYQELYRVLRPGGRLFHYIGNPQSHLGQRLTKGVRQRLSFAGFDRLRLCPEAFGLVAYK